MSIILIRRLPGQFDKLQGHKITKHMTYKLGTLKKGNVFIQIVLNKINKMVTRIITISGKRVCY